MSSDRDDVNEAKSPWVTRSSRTVYSNAWIDVREDDVIRPDGNPGIYGVVSCRVATGVVALSDKGDVCLVGQYRYPLREYSWEIPEGGADKDETPIAAIKRELKEEAGVVANSWDQLGSRIHLSNCHSDEVAFVFLARELRQEQSTPDADEELVVKWVPLSECVMMAKDGRITDALSIIGILRAAQFVGA